MAQKTLDGFFKTQRGGNLATKTKELQKPEVKQDPPQAPKPKKQKLDSDSAGIDPKTRDLARYQYGTSEPSNFYEREENVLRHEAFVKRFGRPNNKPQVRKRNYKPFDLQYIELKKKFMDTILLVEVGYKYKILGRDAVKSARLFGFKEMNGWLDIDNIVPEDALYDRFATFSFPTARLPYYVQKLVNGGFKVGIVTQAETAAIKRAGSHKSGPFNRAISAIYTKGTFIDDFDVASVGENPASYGGILGVYEPRVHEYAIISVNPGTGEIIYDQFKDSPIGTELETRLLHLQPCELVQVGDLGNVALKQIEAIRTRGTNIRVEKVEVPSQAQTDDCLALFPKLREFSTEIQKVSTQIIDYLKEFKLDQVFALPRSYQAFNIASNMYLSGNTLNSLEIFQNLTNFSSEGSLFWVMDHTHTKFGQRLFRKWIAQPLLEREALEHRIEAVHELIHGYCDIIDSLKKRMKYLPDLERNLLQIYYGRITRKQLYYTLYYMQRLSSSFTHHQLKAQGFKSQVLNDLFEKIPQINELVKGFFEMLSETAKEGERVNFFRDDETNSDLKDVHLYKTEITSIRKRFDDYLDVARKESTIKNAKYVSVNGDEYLIEIPSAHIKKVPANWQKISALKSAARFRTPETFKLIRELELATERLEAACDEAFKTFVTQISEKHSEFRESIVAISQIDCLMSLAASSGKPGYVKPEFVDGRCIELVDSRHPAIDVLTVDPYIPNSVHMYPTRSRAMVITGPNMGGKSSFVRQVALSVIMAQVGCFVPAKKARLFLVDAIYTRMGAYDNMMAGESTFQVELKECADILNNATRRSLVLLDEIGRGTSTTDGVAIAYAVLDYIVSQVNAFTLFITHYPLITELAKKYPRVVSNWCMDFRENPDTKIVTFLYNLIPGIAHRSYGLNVARLAEIDESILKLAEEKSNELETQITSRQKMNTILLGIKEILNGNETSTESIKTLQSFCNPDVHT